MIKSNRFFIYLHKFLLLFDDWRIDSGLLQLPQQVVAVLNGDDEGGVVTPELVCEIHHIQQLRLPLFHQCLDVVPQENHTVQFVLHSLNREKVTIRRNTKWGKESFSTFTATFTAGNLDFFLIRYLSWKRKYIKATCTWRKAWCLINNNKWIKNDWKHIYTVPLADRSLSAPSDRAIISSPRCFSVS